MLFSHIVTPMHNTYWRESVCRVDHIADSQAVQATYLNIMLENAVQVYEDGKIGVDEYIPYAFMLKKQVCMVFQ